MGAIMRTVSALALALLVCPAVARAQLSTIHAGDTVRVWTVSGTMTGTRHVVSSAGSDAVEVVAAPGAPATRVTAADIRRIDVARGRHSRWRGALIWGLIAGTAAAAAAGSLTSDPSDREATVPLAGWAGFAAGAAIGARRDPIRWVTVYKR